MNARDLAALVHLVGFATGIVLYGMLGVMARRRLTYVALPGDEGTADRLPLIAAALGLIWNAGAMLIYSMRDFGIGQPLPWVGALAETALGFLPAVVVHSAIGQSPGGRVERWLVRSAYATSLAAGFAHLASAMRGDRNLSSDGLLALTVIYVVILAAVAVTRRSRAGFQRSVTAVALAAFAVSALHLSRHPGLSDTAPWPIELIGHHASLPLVLAILYQDYRFAFADLFLKRALSLLVVVSIASLLYATLAAPLIDPHSTLAQQEAETGSHLFSTGALLGLWIATALIYPTVQRRVFQFVDQIILKRADYREVRADLSRRVASAQDPVEVLDIGCDVIRRALGAELITCREVAPAGHPGIFVNDRRTEARLLVPTAIEPSFELDITMLRGGRTLFSDDLTLLDGVAASIGRRVDEVRLDAARQAADRREREILRLATEAELAALRAQLNPHFLFNALNTLGHLMQAAPDRALTTLYRLTGLLRAVLRRTNGQFVALDEEMEIVESYLGIERERFQERLSVMIDVPMELRHLRVPPLILQPLVENAVKHGIAPLREGGVVTVRVEQDRASDVIRLSVGDSGLGFPKTPTGAGVGLANIENRLRHYYGSSAELRIHSTDVGTEVEVRLPITSGDRVAAVAT